MTGDYDSFHIFPINHLLQTLHWVKTCQNPVPPHIPTMKACSAYSQSIPYRWVVSKARDSRALREDLQRDRARGGEEKADKVDLKAVGREEWTGVERSWRGVGA